MSQRTPDGFVRFDVYNADDLAHLVATGMVWRSGPKVLKLALDAIAAGDIERPVQNAPPAVDAYLDRMGVRRA